MYRTIYRFENEKREILVSYMQGETKTYYPKTWHFYMCIKSKIESVA